MWTSIFCRSVATPGLPLLTLAAEVEGWKGVFFCPMIPAFLVCIGIVRLRNPLTLLVTLTDLEQHTFGAIALLVSHSVSLVSVFLGEHMLWYHIIGHGQRRARTKV